MDEAIDDPVLERWLARLPARTPRVWFSDDPAHDAVRLERRGAVTVVFGTPPARLPGLLAVLKALATFALDRWPRWYADAEPASAEADWAAAEAGRLDVRTSALSDAASARRFDAQTPTALGAGSAFTAPEAGRFGAQTRATLDAEQVARAVPGVLAAWLARAVLKAQAAQLPLFYDLGLALQIEQLRRAAGPVWFALALEAPEGGVLPSLTHGAAWLAERAEAPVVLVVPRGLAQTDELNRIAYGALVEPARVRLAGAPHPASAAEHRLVRALERDAELAPLFAANVRLQSVRGSNYVVDLLWAEGRVVVEIDGFATHGSRHAFRADRQRDYELGQSGYRVLRITDAEIFEDAALAVEKIRDWVRGARPGGGMAW